MWHVGLKFSDETVEFDEEFETKKQAISFGKDMYSSYFTGSRELSMRDPDENPYEEWEDEDPEIVLWED